jgi:subtilase family serine protease
MLRRSVVVLAAGAVSAGVLIAPTAVADLAPDAASRATAAQSAQVATIRADNPEVTFLVGLPRDSEALQQAAVVRSTPGELLYRDHPSLTNAGKTYGAKSKAITRLRSAAKPLGIDVSIDKGRILARLTATVTEWERAYGQRMQITPPSAGYPYRTFAVRNADDYARPPASLRDVTDEWVPLYVEYDAAADTPGVAQATFDSLAGVLASTGSPQPWPRNLGTFPAGTCDAPAVRDRAVYAPGQIQAAYGTTALASRGVRGEGARLTVVSFGGGYESDDLAKAADCFGYAAPRIDVVTGTGVNEPFVNAYVETHLDLITAAAALPRATSLTLLEVTYSPVGITDAFARMLDGQAAPDTVSLSYGICESDYVQQAGDYLTLNEDLLRMAAIVGTSVVAATGDYGSSMCAEQLATVHDGPTVWYPASSPWVTAVGGTRLALKSDNTRRSERVWNDAPYAAAIAPGAAGSGGPSALFDRPWWQPGATPQGPRGIPDVAVLGAIRPGWPVVYGGEVFTTGGTGGAAPFVAANLAAMSARQRDRGFPTIGFANAWLYRAADASKPAFFDIEQGNNGVQLVGCCAAYRGYDMASGLGAPVMDRLYATLPRPAG